MTIRYYNYATKSFETVGENATFYKGSRSIRIFFDEWGIEEYAMYWDGEKIVDVAIDNDAPGRREDERGSVTLDATPKVWRELEEYYRNHETIRLMEDAYKAASAIQKDDKVQVVSGRNNKGANGQVVATILAPYRMGWKSVERRKLGIALTDRKETVQGRSGKTFERFADVVWVWEMNCTKTNKTPIDYSCIYEKANEHAQRKVKSYRKA